MNSFKKRFIYIKKEKPNIPLSQLEYDYLNRGYALKEVPFKDSTECGETFTNLDNNSNIDLNSRLTENEVGACWVIDQIAESGILNDVNDTQRFKRLKVSTEGKGRAEKVSVVAGTKAARKPSSFMDIFKKRKQPEVTEEEHDSK